jgi:hypothetical protein
MLLSAVLNFQTIAFDPGNDLPYILYLPTYTATAWYHKRLSKELMGDMKKALAESQQFAAGEYNLALMKGDALSAQERAQTVRKLARYTGLTPAKPERDGAWAGETRRTHTVAWIGNEKHGYIKLWSLRLIKGRRAWAWSEAGTSTRSRSRSLWATTASSGTGSCVTAELPPISTVRQH